MKTLFLVVNFLKCVVTEVVFNCCFKTQGSVATHLRCGAIFSDSINTNFFPMLTVKKV